MNKKNGKIIVMEGLDGSGKDTQAKLLTQNLKNLDINVKHISFPDYSHPSSSLVKMYLNSEFGDNPSDVNAYASSSFFAVDRYASYMKFWKDFYCSRGTIVADRYVTSNIVYQMCKLPRKEWDDFISWSFDYECEKLGLPYPDIVIYLHVPVLVSQRLMGDRYEGCDERKDLHEKNISFQDACRFAAEYAIDKLNWIQVDCTEFGELKSKEKISEEVLDAVKRGLKDD